MEEENLIATRESFGKALEEIDNEKVVVLDADQQKQIYLKRNFQKDL